MTIQNRTTLKSYFETGDVPTQAQFVDLMDSLSPRPYTFLVAANDAPASVKALADYVCDGTDDDVEIQAALNALPDPAQLYGGGVVMLSSGQFVIGAAATLALGDKRRLIGQGPQITKLLRAAAGTASFVTIGSWSELAGMSITLNAANGAASGIVGSGIESSRLRDLYITGGNEKSIYAISLKNFFRIRAENVYMKVDCNGWELGYAGGNFNYGNSLFSLCEVNVQGDNKIGWDIYGQLGAGTWNVNLMQFDYISAISNSGTGSTGIRIRNAQYLVFTNLDLEKCATSLFIDGQVSGGPVASHNNFTGLFADANVTIGAGAPNTCFFGGRVFGTITDNCVTPNRTTKYYGTAGANGATLP